MKNVSPDSDSATNMGGFGPQPNSAVGGFEGPGLVITSAKDAAAMRDDAYVTLRGNIVQHLGKDKYLFQDASGTIKVEIDNDKWLGQVVEPGDAVELHGEIEKEWFSDAEVDVERVIKLQQ